MMYYIGQAIGVIVTIGVIITLQIKDKNKMLIFSIMTNILSALNILILDSFNSGVIICSVAVFQIFFSLWHDKKGTDASLIEKIVFFVLYVSGGLIGFKTPLDILSIVAAVFYMLAMFQKKEQRIRLFLLGNMLSWTIYHTILGSTAVFAQLAGIASSIVALIRYRNTDKKTDN